MGARREKNRAFRRKRDRFPRFNVYAARKRDSLGRLPVAVPHRVDGLVRADPAQVDVSRSDARVAGRVTHDIQRRTRANEFDRERVPESVRVHAPDMFALRASRGSKCRM
jgi:hypothetical protein